MSQSLVNARRQIVSVGTLLKQGNFLAAAQSLQSGITNMLREQLMKAEKDEMSAMVQDALKALSANAAIKKAFPLALQCTPGEERAFIPVLNDLVSVLEEEAMRGVNTTMSDITAALNSKIEETFARGKAILEESIAPGKEEERLELQGKAVALFDNLLHENPQNAELHARVGTLLLQYGLLEKATASLELAVKLDPDSAFAHNHLGMLYRRTKKLDMAERHFAIAQRLAPQDAHIYFNLGRLYLDAEQWSKARDAADKALELEPEFSEASKLRSYAQSKI